MENNKEALQHIINTIISIETRKGNVASIEEIAKKISIKKEKLLTYLNGSEESPNDLEATLMASYGIERVVVEHIVKMKIILPDDEDEEIKD